jgi:hypothetical protein
LRRVSRQQKKEKGLVRRTILVLATMVVMLLVAGGVALAVVNCDELNYCQCIPGKLCEGTHDTRPGYYDEITGTDSGDNIYAYEGNDVIYPGRSGDYVEAGPGNDEIYEHGAATASGNDTLIGGADDDYIQGGGGTDQCYGGPGTDTTDGSCETWVP